MNKKSDQFFSRQTPVREPKRKKPAGTQIDGHGVGRDAHGCDFSYQRHTQKKKGGDRTTDK